MSTLTSTFVPSAYGKIGSSPVRKQGMLARLFARFIESRQRQAMLELQRHGLRLPTELEAAGWKITERNEDSLPFIR